MEQKKEDQKKPIPRKSRRKVKSMKLFIEETKCRLLEDYEPSQQNLIVKEILFAIAEKRKMLIDQSQEKMDILNQFTSELPTFK